ncbi:hypothetical protein ABK040_000211 [Willaertia magna]
MKLSLFIIAIISILLTTNIDFINCQSNVTPVKSTGEIVLGTISKGTFKYYSITGVTTQKLFLSYYVSGNSYSVYVKKGSTPTLNSFDYKLSKGSTQTISVPTTTETWYIGVYGSDSSTASYQVDILTQELSLPGWIIGVIVASVIVGLLVVIASIAIPILVCCGVCSGFICCAAAVATESDRTPIIQRHVTTTV